MTTVVLALALVISFNYVYGTTKGLMISPESSEKMTFPEAAEHCHKLKAGWRVPEKEELDLFTVKSKKSYWTKSYMHAVGDTSSVVYNFSNGGSYGPPFNDKFHVICIRG